MRINEKSVLQSGKLSVNRDKNTRDNISALDDSKNVHRNPVLSMWAIGVWQWGIFWVVLGIFHLGTRWGVFLNSRVGENSKNSAFYVLTHLEWPHHIQMYDWPPLIFNGELSHADGASQYEYCKNSDFCMRTSQEGILGMLHQHERILR